MRCQSLMLLITAISLLVFPVVYATPISSPVTLTHPLGPNTVKKGVNKENAANVTKLVKVSPEEEVEVAYKDANDSLRVVQFEPELRRRLASNGDDEEATEGGEADESYEYDRGGSGDAQSSKGDSQPFASMRTGNENESRDDGTPTTEASVTSDSAPTTQSEMVPSSTQVTQMDTGTSTASSTLHGGMLSARAATPDSERHTDTNIEHVSKMVLKIVKTYNVRSMVDIPCRNTLAFVPALLHRIDFETPGFKYYCVDTERETHDDIAHLFGDAANPDILHMRPEETSAMPKTDLIFSWDGPQDWGVTRFWSFLMNVRQIRPKYVLVTNNPSETNGDKPGVLNLRKQPFHVGSSFHSQLFLICKMRMTYLFAYAIPLTNIYVSSFASCYLPYSLLKRRG